MSAGSASSGGRSRPLPQNNHTKGRPPGAAFALSGSEYESFRVGDCVKAGNIQKSQRSAFGIATGI